MYLHHGHPNIRLDKEAGEKYGFTLEYKSKKHVAKSPAAGSPAERAGMREGDIVCVINGVDVTEMDHKHALNNAKKNADFIEMTVVDQKAIVLYERLSITITHEIAHELGQWSPALKSEHVEAVVAAVVAPVVEAEPEAEVEPEAEPEVEKIIEHPVAAAAVAAVAVAAVVNAVKDSVTFGIQKSLT